MEYQPEMKNTPPFYFISQVLKVLFIKICKISHQTFYFLLFFISFYISRHQKFFVNCPLFEVMFSGSQISKDFKMSRTKFMYLMNFAIASYFMEIFIDELKSCDY